MSRRTACSPSIRRDRSRTAGSSLTIDGALTNAGTVSVGTGPNAPNFTLDAPDTLTAASINNTGGTLSLWGGPSVLAEVDVAGAASLGTKAGYLDGDVTLSGDSLLQFASGSITTIAAGGELSLTGDEALVERRRRRRKFGPHRTENRLTAGFCCTARRR